MSLLVMAGIVAWMAAFVPGGLRAMKAMRENSSAMPAPTPAYYAANIALSLAAAIAGGWVTARLAGTARTGSLIALGVAVLVMGLVSARTTPSGAQPGWYKILIPVIGVAGVAISAAI
jgi:hypothetical protein